MDKQEPTIPHKFARTWSERINDPSPEVLTRLDSLFARLEELVHKLVANSKTHALFVVGGPGTGKTFVINQILKDLGYYSRYDLERFDAMDPKYYEVFSGIVSLPTVIKTAFWHKKEGQIIMFDNADNFLNETTATDVLKMMLGSGNSRKISLEKKGLRYADLSKLSVEDQEIAEEMLFNLHHWKRDRYEPEELNVGGEPIYNAKTGKFKKKWRGGVNLLTKDGHSKIPNRFKYEGKMIFISNRSIDDIDHALLSLDGVDSMEINLTPVEMLLRMKSLIAQETLGDKEVPMHIKHEIFDALIAHMDEVNIDPNDLSLRTFVNCEKEYLAFPNDDFKEELKFIVPPLPHHMR